MSNVSKEQIKAKLATMFKAKEEAISIYGLKTKFGGGRSSGFALIYDNFDLKKKFDGKCLLKRVCFQDLLFIYVLNRISLLLNHSRQESKRRKSKAE